MTPTGSGQVVSVIVPLSEHPEALDELYEEYSAPLRQVGKIEFVFITGPAHRDLTAALARHQRAGAPIRVLEVGQPIGEADLIRAAIGYCHGSTVLILPSYRRIDAGALPQLLDRIREGADVVVARRWPRRDAWINRLQNRGLHLLLGDLVAGRIHDVACGVMAIRREVLTELPVYGDNFRFLGVIALQLGYRVEEVDAPQHRRDVRARVYRPTLYLRRLLDVLGLYVVVRFTQKPIRFFGFVGFLFVCSGLFIIAYLIAQRLETHQLVSRPGILAGLVLFTLGIEAISLGLVGEIIVFLQSPGRSSYRVREKR